MDRRKKILVSNSTCARNNNLIPVNKWIGRNDSIVKHKWLWDHFVTFVNITIIVYCTLNTNNMFGWMQDGSIVGNVISSMALMKSIIKTDACHCNNQQNMRWNLILGKTSNFFIQIIWISK